MTNVPIPTGYDVYWKKWVDAYDNDELTHAQKSFEEEIERDSDDYDNTYQDPPVDDELPFFNQHIKTILTPFGVLPLTEHSLASKHFKFWVGHTNFKLWDKYYPVIGDVLGVESVDILTPLRFRIAVGELFQDRDVMDKVRGVLLGAIEDEPKV